MINKIVSILLIVLLTFGPVLAGNKVIAPQLILDEEGFNAGGRAEYIISSNMEVLFDGDFPLDLSQEVISEINSLLVDIKLDPEISDIDYESASELFSFDPRYSKAYAPNRIFVFLGGGYYNEFYATLRTYEDGTPTCQVVLRKNLWEHASYTTKKIIVTHEIYHCLGWDHPAYNPYTDNFDFASRDNNEVLDRLYDKNNTKDLVTVSFNNPDNLTVGFIAKKRVRGKNSVYTTQDEVKLIKGVYKIAVNDRYIRGITKKGAIKYTKKLRKAKKFKINRCSEQTIEVINDNHNNN
jgi:hypothetical protein